MAFGARVLKTGMAVTLALLVSQWLSFSPPVIAGVAAIFAVQPSIYRSWRYFLEQLQTNTVGAVLGLLAGMFFANNPIAIGVVCILVIVICLKINMEETIGLSLVTVIAVMEATGQWHFALNRFLLIVIGIGSAFLINILFFPPNPKAQFIGQIHSIFNKMSLLLRTAISDEIKENVFNQEKKELEDAINNLSDKYTLFEEELKKLKRAKYSEIRELVVYKQTLHALRKGLDVLEAVEEHYFQAPRTRETDEYFDGHLERLIKFHEHALLKFDDKLKSASAEPARLEAENERFMKWVTKMNMDEQDGILRLSVVAAAMYDYGYQTGRLYKLVNNVDMDTGEKEQYESFAAWLRR